MAPRKVVPTRYVPAGKPKPRTPKRGKLGRFVRRITRRGK